jgi:hypothetical protein
MHEPLPFDLDLDLAAAAAAAAEAATAPDLAALVGSTGEADDQVPATVRYRGSVAHPRPARSQPAQSARARSAQGRRINPVRRTG